MISLGIDPSSYAVGIVAAETGGEMVYHEQWKTGLVDTKDPQLVAAAMLALFARLSIVAEEVCPEVVTIEQLAMAQSLNTVRAILYFEATAMLWTHKQMLPLHKVVATSMRRAVFGKGNLSKDQCAEIVRTKLGKLDKALPSPRAKIEQFTFSDDETDAYAYAVFGLGEVIEWEVGGGGS